MYYTARDIAEFARRKKRKRVRNILLGGAGVGALAGGGLLLTRGKSGKVPVVSNVPMTTNIAQQKTAPISPTKGSIAMAQTRQARRDSLQKQIDTGLALGKEIYNAAKRDIARNSLASGVRNAKRAAGASGKRKFKTTKRRTQPTKLRAIPKRLGGMPVGMQRKKVDRTQEKWENVVLPNNKPWYYFVPDK